jgi:hypothetical protein
MYISIDFIISKGVPCPTKKEISYANLISNLTLALKLGYY